MPDDQAARPSGTGIAVVLRIEDDGLRDRISAALRKLPDIDGERAAGGGAPITVTDSIEAMRRASFLRSSDTGGLKAGRPHGAGALAFRRPTAALRRVTPARL